MIEAISGKWAKLQQKLESMPEYKQEAFLNLFNTVIPDQEDLGYILFGDFKNFKSRVEGLNKEHQDAFVKKLMEEKIIQTDTKYYD